MNKAMSLKARIRNIANQKNKNSLILLKTQKIAMVLNGLLPY